MRSKKTNPTLSCITCGASNKKNSGLVFIQDSESHIGLCSLCIHYFNSSLSHVLSSGDSQQVQQKKEVLPTPKDIYQALNRDVVKQDHAKRAISIAVAHHYRRLKDPSIGKSNILLIGPTGTGKTELARSVAKYLNVPFTTIDASAITAKGYMGEDADSGVKRLLLQAHGDVELAESGIIFIDEVDKIARRDGPSGGDIGTTAVQQQLLKILEGDRIPVKLPTTDGRELSATIDTSKILFVCSGAFVGLESIVNEKATKKTIGFQSPATEKQTEEQGPIHTRVEAEHFKKFGLIPEFFGRLPVVTSTEQLSVDDLAMILKEPENSLVRQNQALFLQDDITINFHEDFLKEVAAEASVRGIGARGLRQVMEKKMENIHFNIEKYIGQRIEVCAGGRIMTFSKEVPSSKLLSLSDKEEIVTIKKGI